MIVQAVLLLLTVISWPLATVKRFGSGPAFFSSLVTATGACGQKSSSTAGAGVCVALFNEVGNEN